MVRLRVWDFGRKDPSRQSDAFQAEEQFDLGKCTQIGERSKNQVPEHTGRLAHSEIEEGEGFAQYAEIMQRRGVIFMIGVLKRDGHAGENLHPKAQRNLLLHLIPHIRNSWYSCERYDLVAS